ncbi:MAG TPA: LysM peptidoglycan-binding domain-containing M23 family metallopeptidase [Acidimicrobiales bacterium]|nr:LysM peptidoglycan-binding domain-containing M23 family metallopeptidase [Acidimicrobiales bacterium]
MLVGVAVVAAALAGAGGLAVALTSFGSTYTVAPGDTLGEIAVRLHIPLDELAAANGITDADRIVAGQILVLPAPASSDVGDGRDAGGGSTAGYVVAPGDTLSDIADRLGVPVARLAEANGIDDPDLLQEGMVLVLPGTGGGVATGYVVREGDTLIEVAERLGTTVDELVLANNIEDPDNLLVGTVLTVAGTWRCPVDGPVWFSNDFGRPWGPGVTHRGIDLFAARGTPVVAPVSGVVERHPNPLGGEAFALNGDDGVWYYGAHLEAYGAEGRVSAGTVVGYVGNSGDARDTSPHLHFESHPPDSDAVNPYPSLVGACRQG